MPASEARIAANRANALKSTGPKTEEGKQASRANSYKHGLTGAGVVMPEADAAEVERIARALQAELKPPGEVGKLLVRQVATMSVRMDRSARQETAALSELVRAAMAEFEPPEGVDAETADRLRAEAGNLALFDDSKGATLARRYDQASRRSFFRALDAIRRLKKDAEAAGPAIDHAAEARASLARLGSFLQVEAGPKPKAVPAAPAPIPARLMPVSPAWDPFAPAHSDVPIAIGRRR